MNECEQIGKQVELQRRVVRRRALFEQVFTPEVMQCLAEWMGVDEAIFAFVPGGDGRLDALEACRIDTLMGILRGIRFEIAHKEEGERALVELLELQKKGGVA